MFAERDLVAHFLHGSGKSFNLLLHLRDSRALFLDLAVFPADSAAEFRGTPLALRFLEAADTGSC